MSKKKGIMVGVGGMASLWLEQLWPPFSDRMEWAALVDVNAEALASAGEKLGVPAAARFTSVREAMEKVEADFCCVVTPPAFHQEAIELACDRKLHILSEKPIADTWEACCAIYQKVQQSGVKMQVTQNYRYNTNIQTLKKAVSELGEINYVIARYASDYRVRNSWGKFRHEIPHTLLVEGGIHHLDQIRHLTEANCFPSRATSGTPAASAATTASGRAATPSTASPARCFRCR
jgi:predicted dehydrogenase